jgi:general nucleoside transport system permease protein
LQAGKVFSVWRRRLRESVLSTVVVLISVVVGALLVSFEGRSPLAAYGTIVSSTFGSPESIGYTLSQSAPLILVAMGLVIAFKGSFWNGGGEGQMLLGGITGVVATYSLHVNSTPLLLLVGFVAAFMVSGAWASISGILKVLFGIDDIVSSLLLSATAAFIVFYLVRVPFASTSTSSAAVLASVNIPNAAQFPSIAGISGTFPLAISCAVVLAWVLAKTKFGFRLKVLGSNRNTAVAYFGKGSSNRLFVMVSFLSGGFIGMGGMAMVSAFTGNIVAGASGGAYSAGGFTNSYGFIGIAVVFLAGLDPLASIAASIFFVTLVIGGLGLLVLMAVPTSLTISISGVAILFVSARVPLMDRLRALRRPK